MPFRVRFCYQTRFGTNLLEKNLVFRALSISELSIGDCGFIIVKKNLPLTPVPSLPGLPTDN